MIKLTDILKEIKIQPPNSVSFDFKYQGRLYVLKNLRFEINYTHNGENYEDVIKVEGGQILDGVFNSNGDAYCGRGVLIPNYLCKIMTNKTDKSYPKNIDPSWETPLEILDNPDSVSQQIKHELQITGISKPQIV